MPSASALDELVQIIDDYVDKLKLNTTDNNTLIALEKTFKSNNITVEDWNTLINAVEGLVDIKSLSLEEFLNKLKEVLTSSYLSRLQDGEPSGSIQQLGFTISGENEFGGTAYGIDSIALQKETETYQVASFAIGGKTVAGNKDGDPTEYSYAFATGEQTIATGRSSASFGIRSESTGKAAFTTGGSCKATNEYATAHGLDSEATAHTSFAAGDNAKAVMWASAAFGHYNDYTHGALFMVGNGADATHRSNAFEVYGNGTAELQAQGQNPNSIVIKSYLEAHIEELRDDFGDLKSKPLGTLELIHSETLTQYVQSYDYDFEEPLKHIVVVISNYDNAGGLEHPINVSFGDLSVGSIIIPSDSSSLTAKIDFETFEGYLKGTYSAKAAAATSDAKIFNLVSLKNSIDNITLICSNSFALNTRIDIYGVKA